MMLRRRRERRTGAVLVEAAIVYPLLFALVFAIITLGIGVFRYQQCAHAAREGARWAAVHGKKYSEETGYTAATPADVYATAIAPHAGGMRPPDLTYAVAWASSNDQTSTTAVTNSSGQTTLVTRQNTVTVTVTYRYDSVLFGVIPVSSTFVMTMSY